MRVPVLLVAALAVAPALSGCLGPISDEGSDGSRSQVNVRLSPIVEELEKPVHVAFLGGGHDRFLVAEQAGRVRVVEDGQLRQEPLIDLRERVSVGGERGLLSVAPHPEFETNGTLIASWTNQEGNSVLARFQVDPASLEPVDPSDHDVLLTVEQPHPNHNGGYAVFGPDGYLYYGLGDGGGTGDPDGNGQDEGTLLGSILRLGVGDEGNVSIPEDNPFVGEEGRDEIWAYGLRNPWRFSFDQASGDLWIGDVGEDDREEVNWEPRVEGGGLNYGWNAYEGSRPFEPGNVSRDEVVFPVAEYPTHENGTCSITGGYVYWGSEIIDLSGAYVFADYCTGTIWTLRHVGEAWHQQTLLETDLRITSFAQTAGGELAVVDHGGGVHVIEAAE